MSAVDSLKETLSKYEIEWRYQEFSPHDILLSEIIDNLRLKIKWKNKTGKCRVFVNFNQINKDDDDLFTINITPSNMTLFPHIMYTSVSRLITMSSLVDEYVECFRNAGWVKQIKHFPCKVKRYLYQIGPADTPYRFYWYYLSSGKWCLKIPCRENLYLVIPERIKYLSCLEPFAYLGLRGKIPGIKPSKLLNYRLESFAKQQQYKRHVNEIFLKIKEHIVTTPCSFPIINQKDGYVKFIELTSKLNPLFELYSFTASYLGVPLLLKSDNKVYIQSENELVLRYVLEGIYNSSLFGKKGVFLCGAPQLNCAFFSLSE